MKNLFFLLFLAISMSVNAQVAINSDGSLPDNSAMLDVKAIDRGLLIPRISTAARNLVPSPATGLLIYNSTTNRFDYFNGSFWYQLGTAFISSSVGTVNPGGGVAINVLPDILPDNSAMLDINDPTRGILIPRISTSARDLISSPATGLIIYNTNTNLLDYYNGTQWIALCSVSTGIPGAGGSQATVGVAVNTDNSSPDPSAMLDVASGNKGVLIPGLTNAQRDAILPVTGLVIYNTSSNYIEFYNGSAWYLLITDLLVPPTGGTHFPTQNQIIWNWNAVAGAAGYKWNTINDYATATDMAAATTNTETGLVCATAYTRYVWAYNDCGFSPALTLTRTTLPCINCVTPIVDARDGQSYNTVQIGAQCWMAENLNIGTMIQDGNNMTNNGITEKYCYDNNTANCDTYGGLYQWKEMMEYSTTPGVQGICPSGWHVPTNDEWTVLTDLLGGEPVAGGEMKTTGTIEAGTGLWHDPNTAATNSSGFSALPGGYRQDGGGFTYLSDYGNFWTSTEITTEYVWFRNLFFQYAFVYGSYGVIEANGYSVRCVKDTPPPVWSCGDPLPDTRDNQTYNTVQIGTQCWMAENLNIGTTIPGATDMANNSIIEKYCNENNTANCDTYGGLYQWNEMMEYSATPGVQGICPTGWHLPTDAEWTVLTAFLGGESIAGGEMKTTGTIEAGTGLWYAPNNGATNSSGFSALPGGYRYGPDLFNTVGGNANFWSSSEYNINDAVCRELLTTITNVGRYSISKSVGFSSRCIKDTPPPVWSCGDPLLDTRDNQTYNTVQIDTQCWMAENLNIGTTIPGATDMANNSIAEKYCLGNNTANCDVYGGLYQWNEMMQYSTAPGVQGICPAGWHLPAHSEWTILTTFLGGESIAGGKMKTTGTIEAGTGLWYAPNTGATNESGFSALPGDLRNSNGSFSIPGLFGSFWSSTENDTFYAVERRINYGNTEVDVFSNGKRFGLSVRCIQGEYINLPPSQPAGPNPSDNSQNQSIFTQPSWTCTDPENDPLTYDVYFGTSDPLSLVSSGQTGTSYNPGILENNTPYSWKIVAHDNHGNTTEGPVWSFITISDVSWQCGDPLPDTRDNQTYNTVQIGTKCWMAENLNIGMMIPGTTEMANNSIIEKYCYNDSTAKCDVYGGLYEWDEIMQYGITPGAQGICQAGWHIPTVAEWTVLTNILGGQALAGGKMKATGTIQAGTGLWYTPNAGATNSSGFTALPGGWRNSNPNATFSDIGFASGFWSSTEQSADFAWDCYLTYYNASVLIYYDYEGYATSVRCVKDGYSNEPPTMPSAPNPSDNTQNQPVNTVLSWTCTDAENDPVTYDVYFGTYNFPALVSSGQADTSYSPGTLAYSTSYSWKIVAHDNNNNTTEGPLWSFTTISAPLPCGNPLLDIRDNQTYNTVQIGTQCWMAKNLNIGTMIPGANQMTANSMIEKYCYDNDTTNCDVYGGLYQWNEMMQYGFTPGAQGICPTGWHLPSYADWIDLTDFLGGESVAGGKMKETGTTHWTSPNTGATNSSGFTGLPGGFRRHVAGTFEDLGHSGYFWSSEEAYSPNSFYTNLNYNAADFYLGNNFRDDGFSVRCLQD